MKASKMTPADESFSLRARNANEKRADIILSRSNSDFPFANSKSPNQVRITLNNPETRNKNAAINRNLILHNSINFGSQNPNYTGYGNLHRDSSSNNTHSFYNQKQNSALTSSLKENNKISGAGGALNSKIQRSPMEPRKSSKISPPHASLNFNASEKPSRESLEKEMFRTSYNSAAGAANGYSGLYNNFENTKQKFYAGSSNGTTNNNGNVSNNVNNLNNMNNNGQNSLNLLVVNSSSLSKSVSMDGNGINEINYVGGRNYLPNVISKSGNGNGKEKGLYNGNQQYILSERK